MKKFKQYFGAGVVGVGVAVLANINPAAALDYNFSLSAQTFNTTGTISTDGTLGNLSSSNIKGWNLLFTDTTGSRATDTLTNLNSTLVPQSSIMSATSSTLTIDPNNTKWLIYRTQGNTNSTFVQLNNGLDYISVSSSSNGSDYKTGSGPQVYNFGSAANAAAVPFEIPGGATIPAVGGLLALGVMRKARKSLASNTRIANPVCGTVS